MVSKKIERKIEDIILGLLPIPYADREIIEVAEGFIGVDLPGLPHIELSEMSTGHKILLLIFGGVPFLLDAEYLDLIGMDPFKKDEANISDNNNFENAKGKGDYKSKSPNRNSMSRRNDREYRDLSKKDSSGGISLPWKTAGKLFGGGIMILVLIVGGISMVGGSGYGMLASDMLGGHIDGFSGLTESVGYQVNQAIKTVTCFGNAGCIREWRLNNTQRPGSEDVGETYRLVVNGPQITGGNDVRYQPKDASIPVDFRVKNTRHGLKGIDAKNVSYRVKIRNPGILDKGESFCKTGWRPLNKYGSDAQGEAQKRNNLLLPGQSASPLNYGNGDDSTLSLYECGLMNPVDTNVEAVVQVKYDYSAMAFLNLQTMASKNFQGSVDEKISKTPNTPVETSIHGPNPVLFDILNQGQNKERIARPFQAQIQISTDQKNVKFQIDGENFRLTDSSITQKGESCKGLTKVGENTFKFSKNIIKRIQRRQERNDWFSSRVSTPQATCTFTLEEPQEVSATGETITMTATANYTVKQDAKSEGFNIRNTLCSTQNCPLLVPLKSQNLNNEIMSINLDQHSPYDFQRNGANWDHSQYMKKEYAYCNRPFDAETGCSVVQSWSLQDRQNPLPGKTIKAGDIALELTGNYGGNGLVTCHVKSLPKNGEEKANENLVPEVISIRPDQLEKAFYGKNTALNYTGTREGGDIDRGQWVIIEDYSPSNC